MSSKPHPAASMACLILTAGAPSSDAAYLASKAFRLCKIPACDRSLEAFQGGLSRLQQQLAIYGVQAQVDAGGSFVLSSIISDEKVYIL